MFIIYSISLSSHTKFLFYVYFMLTVAPGGNNLANICYKDFLGLATINMYYYYYYYVLGYKISMARMYPVFYLLCDIRRQQGSQYRLPLQHPITLLHLQQLFNFVSCNISNVHDKCMLRSIFTLVFFGMLRYSEYTCF